MDRGNPKKGHAKKRLTRIVWSRAEHQLHQTKGDKLVIFDCCYAGMLALANRSVFSKHIFEFIGSTRHNATAVGPGDDSFTRALIWALTDLSTSKDGFTTTKLMQKIESSEDLAAGQSPVCSERGRKQSLYKLTLVPLPASTDSPTQPPPDSPDQELETPVHAYLQLQLLFGNCPQSKHISQLTRHLCELGIDIPLKQVLWKGLSPYKMSFPDVAMKWRDIARRKSIAKKHEMQQNLDQQDDSGEMVTPMIDPQHSDETLVDTSVTLPMTLKVPQLLVENADIHPRPIESAIMSRYMFTKWQQSVPSFLLVFLLGVTAAQSGQFLHLWRQRR